MNLGVGAQAQALVFGMVQLCPGRPLIQRYLRSSHLSILLKARDVELAVICMVRHNRHLRAVAEERRMQLAPSLGFDQGSRQGFQLQHPQKGRQGPTLGQAVVDGEVMGEPTIDEHAGAGAVHQAADPATHARRQAHGVSAGHEPLTVDAIIGLFFFFFLVYLENQGIGAVVSYERLLPQTNSSGLDRT
jgi:hypothetical protein